MYPSLGTYKIICRKSKNPRGDLENPAGKTNPRGRKRPVFPHVKNIILVYIIKTGLANIFCWLLFAEPFIYEGHHKEMRTLLLYFLSRSVLLKKSAYVFNLVPYRLSKTRSFC